MTAHILSGAEAGASAETVACALIAAMTPEPLREFIAAAKAIRAALDEIGPEVTGDVRLLAEDLIDRIPDDDINVSRSVLKSSMGDPNPVEVDQLRIVIPVDGKVTGVVRVGDLLTRFDRALAALTAEV